MFAFVEMINNLYVLDDGVIDNLHNPLNQYEWCVCSTRILMLFQPEEIWTKISLLAGKWYNSLQSVHFKLHN